MYDRVLYTEIFPSTPRSMPNPEDEMVSIAPGDIPRISSKELRLNIEFAVVVQRLLRDGSEVDLGSSGEVIAIMPRNALLKSMPSRVVNDFPDNIMLRLQQWHYENN